MMSDDESSADPSSREVSAAGRGRSLPASAHRLFSAQEKSDANERPASSPPPPSTPLQPSPPAASAAAAREEPEDPRKAQTKDAAVAMVLKYVREDKYQLRVGFGVAVALTKDAKASAREAAAPVHQLPKSIAQLKRIGGAMFEQMDGVMLQVTGSSTKEKTVDFSLTTDLQGVLEDVMGILSI
jgi:pyruvate/2-oxoglutarate dehydrogenase complex dihydrolipoamide acyltransferase (E2) component